MEGKPDYFGIAIFSTSCVCFACGTSGNILAMKFFFSKTQREVGWTIILQLHLFILFVVESLILCLYLPSFYTTSSIGVAFRATLRNFYLKIYIILQNICNFTALEGDISKANCRPDLILTKPDFWFMPLILHRMKSKTYSRFYKINEF